MSEITKCCICGKNGLSTIEDGGSECEIEDDRWVCSRECYDVAVPYSPRRAWVKGNTVTAYHGSHDNDGFDPRVAGCVEYVHIDDYNAQKTKARAAYIAALADAGQAYDAYEAQKEAERVADEYREILKDCAMLLDGVQPHLDLAAYAEQVQEAGESLRLVTAQKRADRARELVKLIGELE